MITFFTITNTIDNLIIIVYNPNIRTSVLIFNFVISKVVIDLSSQRWYFCIDMKCFFASVECAERGLNPFTTNLVVTDKARGKNAICLAITPKMKSLGIKNRCRVSDIPNNVKYISAKPRMKNYIKYAADIYDIYLEFISPDDIHTYSIDEAFLDVTDYLKIYNITPYDFANKLINLIAERLKIPSTVGIGTNLYLAKVALDITAKKSPDHIGFLTEDLFKSTLWHHQPLTDFWGIGSGLLKRFKELSIYNMEDITKTPSHLLYQHFGINAELIIDHAYGRETCLISDIKNYRVKSHSMCNSEILFNDYDFEKCKIVVSEHALSLTHRLLRDKLITKGITLYIGYSNDNISSSNGSIRLPYSTNSFTVINEYLLKLYERIVSRTEPIRRVAIFFNDTIEECAIGYDFFTDVDLLEREKKAELAVINIKDKFGKNAVLRGIDFLEGATAKERNKMIGGHNSE